MLKLCDQRGELTSELAMARARDVSPSERFESWSEDCVVAKVNSKLGLVFGYAVISERDGRPYFDKQQEQMTEDGFLKAALDFVLVAGAAAKEMHVKEDPGCCPFIFPLTKEIAKALEITARSYGILVGMKPSSAVFEKFEDGTYTGFSIGGRRVKSDFID